VITTPSHAKGAQQTATYQVADLVIRINDSGGLNQTSATPVGGATMNRPGAPPMPTPVTRPNTPQPGTSVGTGSGSGGSLFGGGTADNVSVTMQRSKTTEESLMQLITSTVEPGSWSERGGPGTIEYHPLTMSLVINQTPDVQERVADLLAALRRYAAPPAATEDPVKRKAAELMKRFNTLYKEGKYHEAEVCATAAQVLAPEDPVAIAAIEAARKQGCPTASPGRAPVSESPRARKAHRRPGEMQEVAPR
jgi:hypothetical protein